MYICVMLSTSNFFYYLALLVFFTNEGSGLPRIEPVKLDQRQPICSLIFVSCFGIYRNI